MSTAISRKNAQLVVPDDPIIPYIEGDGTGPDIWRATQYVIDGGVKKAYGGKKSIVWREVYAGDKANEKFGNYLPEETLNALQHYRVSIKGPLSKPVSEFGSKRLVRKAIEYAVAAKRDSVTLVHKGNIMKFTEGAFKEWGYQVAKEEFGQVTIPESELSGTAPAGKIVIKDRIADS